MRVSESIERLIKQMLTRADGETIDLQRNELANQLGCVPSQINYVISTRFTNEHGYSVESKRGGGGYIRITRRSMDKSSYLMHIVNSIGNSISMQCATVFLKNCAEIGVITEREAHLILAGIGDNALSIGQPHKDILRARILKNMLVTLI